MNDDLFMGPNHKLHRVWCKGCGDYTVVQDDGYGHYPKEVESCLTCSLIAFEEGEKNEA